MIENNKGQNFVGRNEDTDDVNSSLGMSEEDQQLTSGDSSDLSDQEDNPLTSSAANEQDNDKEQPNLAADMADKNRNIATSFHDNMRRTPGRANEANDRLDTGSGGLSAGGVKSATDL